MEFWRFSTPNLAEYVEIHGEYKFLILFLSLLVSTLAAYSFMVVLTRMWHTNTIVTRKAWKRFGSVSFGIGVWSMHFTGMLAFAMPVHMEYDTFLTIISTLPPMAGAYIAAKIIALQQFTFIRIQCSSLSLALGIGIMHYLGMEAMQMDAIMRYDLGLFVLSIVCAHVFATIAIYIVVYVHTRQLTGAIRVVGSAVVMGASIACMHYVAMQAAHFYVPQGADGGMVHDSHALMSLGITTLVFVIFATTILGSIFDKRLQAAEHVARVSAEREKSIVENLADGLIVLDQSGRIESMNSQGHRIFHLDESERVRGMDIHQVLPSFDIKLLETSLLDIGEQHVMQMDGRRHDLTTFPCEVNFSFMSITAEERMLYNMVIRDITSRLQLEDQLRQAQKMESIGQLSAGIAHEINTPTQYVSDNISFIKGALETYTDIINELRSYLDAQPAESQSEQQKALSKTVEDADIEFLIDEVPIAVEQSIEGIQRIAKIVGAMKSFSHASEDEMQKVDLAEAISSTITVARSEWRYVADLETNFDPQLPLVTCKRDEVNQVILNFIVNAAHAIEERYGSGGNKSGLIKVAAYPEGESVVVQISDNGTGMPDNVVKRIFEPFFTTKPPGKGTGQGLSLAYAVIFEKHKGRILVESEVGTGTTFKIVLPVEQAGMKKQAAEDEGIIC